MSSPEDLVGLLKQNNLEKYLNYFSEQMLLYGAAIIISGFCCFQLVTNNSIETYFTSNFSGKKVYDENKTRYNQR